MSSLRPAGIRPSWAPNRELADCEISGLAAALASRNRENPIQQRQSPTVARAHMRGTMSGGRDGRIFSLCLRSLARLEQHLSAEPIPALQLKECFAE